MPKELQPKEKISKESVKKIVKNVLYYTSLLVIGFLMYLFFSKGTQGGNQDPRTKAIHAQFNKWTGEHYNLTSYIKETLNDPKSYEHIETFYIDMDSYLIVSTNYRAKNVFGGVVPGSMRAMVSFDGTVYRILTDKEALYLVSEREKKESVE